MEELKTSDILIQEVLEDARKKAAKLLKSTEREISEAAAAAEKSLQKEIDDLRQSAQNRQEMVVREIRAALPLEKLRARIQFAERALSSSLDDFFLDLFTNHPAMWADMMVTFLSRISRLVSPVSYRVHYSGISRSIIESIVKAASSGMDLVEWEEKSGYRGFILFALDNSHRIRITEEEIRTWLLDEKREELFNALFTSGVSAS